VTCTLIDLLVSNIAMNGNGRVAAQDLRTEMRWLGLSIGTEFGGISMAKKYGSTAQTKVKKAMHELKTGELRSGRSGKKVTSKKQAIAIGLSEARKEGGKVPAKKTRKKSM
jgi:hypothetical protein